MSRIPTEQFSIIFKANGGSKTEKLYSYVVVLTEANGSEVQAVRYDGFARKTDVYKKAREEWPGWNLKLINRLYEDDFEERNDEDL